eukprot:31354-Pelagococcus_subviridis.AAC.12
MNAYSRPSPPRAMSFFGLCLEANTSTSGSNPTICAYEFGNGGTTSASYCPGTSTPWRYSVDDEDDTAEEEETDVTSGGSNEPNHRENCAAR